MSDDSKELWTVGRLLKWATDDFRARGIEAPRLDAEVLLAHRSLGTLRVDAVDADAVGIHLRRLLAS